MLADGWSRSPWQNGYVERLIGPIRREALDHLVVFGEAQLRGVLKSYAAYLQRSPYTPFIEEECAGVSAPAEARQYNQRPHPRRTFK